MRRSYEVLRHDTRLIIYCLWIILRSIIIETVYHEIQWWPCNLVNFYYTFFNRAVLIYIYVHIFRYVLQQQNMRSRWMLFVIYFQFFVALLGCRNSNNNYRYLYRKSMLCIYVRLPLFIGFCPKSEKSWKYTYFYIGISLVI